MKTVARLLATSVLLASSAAYGLAPLATHASRVGRGSSPLVQPIENLALLSSPVVSSSASPTTSSPPSLSPRGGGFSLKTMDLPLLGYFAFWYLGNYYYNITNKMALKAAGGKLGFPMTVASLQMGIGCVYGLGLWLVPDARDAPKLTMDDIVKVMPVAFCAMGSHCASVFAMNMGAVSFAQIVKSAEPVFAAVLAQFVYGKKVSKAKWLCLPIVVGGVILSSVKELDFAWLALISACVGNLFAAFKGNENKKLMDTEGLKDRMGSVGNLFAVTTMLGFLFSIPLAVVREGKDFPAFISLYKSSPLLSFNLISSALWWYGYNELATMTIKKTSAVTQSVANTAKRVIVIVGCAIVFGESLAPVKMIGCSIGIAGVLLYSVIDGILEKMDAKKAALA